jgi:hypothetical protein
MVGTMRPRSRGPQCLPQCCWSSPARRSCGRGNPSRRRRGWSRCRCRWLVPLPRMSTRRSTRLRNHLLVPNSEPCSRLSDHRSDRSTICLAVEVASDLGARVRTYSRRFITSHVRRSPTGLSPSAVTRSSGLRLNEHNHAKRLPSPP